MPCRADFSQRRVCDRSGLSMWLVTLRSTPLSCPHLLATTCRAQDGLLEFWDPRTTAAPRTMSVFLSATARRVEACHATNRALRPDLRHGHSSPRCGLPGRREVTLRVHLAGHRRRLCSTTSANTRLCPKRCAQSGRSGFRWHLPAGRRALGMRCHFPAVGMP